MNINITISRTTITIGASFHRCGCIFDTSNTIDYLWSHINGIKRGISQLTYIFLSAYSEMQISPAAAPNRTKQIRRILTHIDLHKEPLMMTFRTCTQSLQKEKSQQKQDEQDKFLLQIAELNSQYAAQSKIASILGEGNPRSLHTSYPLVKQKLLSDPSIINLEAERALLEAAIKVRNVVEVEDLLLRFCGDPSVLSEPDAQLEDLSIGYDDTALKIIQMLIYAGINESYNKNFENIMSKDILLNKSITDAKKIRGQIEMEVITELTNILNNQTKLMQNIQVVFDYAYSFHDWNNTIFKELTKK